MRAVDKGAKRTLSICPPGESPSGTKRFPQQTSVRVSQPGAQLARLRDKTQRSLPLYVSPICPFFLAEFREVQERIFWVPVSGGGPRLVRFIQNTIRIDMRMSIKEGALPKIVLLLCMVSPRCTYIAHSSCAQELTNASVSERACALQYNTEFCPAINVQSATPFARKFGSFTPRAGNGHSVGGGK